MIKILPNIYLSTNFDILNNDLSNNNIDSIIVFSDQINNSDKQNISNNNNSLSFQNIAQSYPIDFNFLENTIINYLTFSKNLLLISKDNLYGFTVVSSFIMKYLKIPFIDIIILSKYHKINFNNTQEYIELSIYCNKIKLLK
jgi:hypothetical protein